MGMIVSLFGSSIVEKASDSLILSLTPIEELAKKEQLSKIDLICARNRILKALMGESTKIQDPAQQKLLQMNIQQITNFFAEIGGDLEQKEEKLSFFSPSKLIEGPIPGAIIASTKPDHLCSKKEIAEKEEQKGLRKQIVDAAYTKASSPLVFERLTLLLSRLGYKHS